MMKKEEEQIREVGKISEELWQETFGITGKEVTTIADRIDNIFHEQGYVIPHNKIEHFVVDAIRKK